MATSSPPEPPPAVRAQLLATEHAGLLAARSTAQSEVLTRITIFLTLFSAGLVSIALIGQATQFAGLFGPSTIAVLSIIIIVGQLTQIRVMNVGIEDLAYVLGMNRIRSAYLELDPGIARYLLTSPNDDQAGSRRTYDLVGARPPLAHVGGSSMVLIVVVNAILLGLLTAAICLTANAPTWVTFGLGALIAVAVFVVFAVRGERMYRRVWSSYQPVNPTR